jgi:carbamoyl-phosphate synthase small subunit
VPSTWPASETLKLNPDGVLFSNGPGDPSAVPYAVETVKNIIGKVPVFGICMGHQLLGQALGGTTYKMKFGHHGGNHPVRNLRTGRVEISSQVCKLMRFFIALLFLSIQPLRHTF